MPNNPKYLIIGSNQSHSGKSATILGAAHQLQQRGVVVGYGKPLGNNSTEVAEADVSFMTEALKLSDNQIQMPLLSVSQDMVKKCLETECAQDYSVPLKEYVSKIEGDLVFIEGPSNLSEGSLLNLSVERIAQIIDAPVILISHFNSQTLVDELLSAKKMLGKYLLGVVINDVQENQLETAETIVKPFLEQQGIAVLGVLPRSSLLRSVSVRYLAKQLNAKVLCRENRLDLMVESLKIGAMNVNSALEYFRQSRNMAVVTGGDRRDLQMAALETSTNCLILTGHSLPHPDVVSRADDLEVPILSVDLDTLTTVEIADYAFGQVRLKEPIKVQFIQELMAQYFDVERLMDLLGIEPKVALS